MQSLNAEFYTYGKARPARVDKQGKRRWIVTVRGGKTGNTRYFLADSDDDKGYAWTTRLHKARSFYSWDGAESRLRSLRKKYPGSDKLKRAKRQVAAGRVSAEHHKKRRTKKSATKKRATKKRASKRRTTKKKRGSPHDRAVERAAGIKPRRDGSAQGPPKRELTRKQLEEMGVDMFIHPPKMPPPRKTTRRKKKK